MSTALVTGATAGIGREFARQLAERGHDVVLVARDRPRLEDLSDELTRTYGVRCEVLAADLSDRAQMQRVADRLTASDDPVDLLISNAGYGLTADFLHTDVEEQEALLDVLVRAVLVLSHAAGGSMRARGHGAIVNVSSVAGFTAGGPYSAAKSWVTVFSEGLAAELKGSGVTVTALLPGLTRTEFHERAGMDLSSIPGALWLSASRLVRECLDDVARGAVISVPTKRYKAAVSVLRVLPRQVVRSRRLGGRR